MFCFSVGDHAAAVRDLAHVDEQGITGVRRLQRIGEQQPGRAEAD